MTHNNMLSKNKITHLRALHTKKKRKEQGRFLVEGKKSILECIDSDMEIIEGFFTHEILSPIKMNFPYQLISESELKKITTLTSNRDGVLVVAMPQKNLSQLQDNLTLVLDGINDPGNLGTIIRTADWYGIKNIIASKDTVDYYNSKVIMASMGSFVRVNVFYEDLEEFFGAHSFENVY